MKKLLIIVLALFIYADEWELKMPKTGLSFQEIKGYEDYRVVATHYRTDKNELRYILANDIAYKALKSGVGTMPEGSKIVKIGWDVKAMESFPVALEAKTIQRVEYMIRDKRLHKEADGWGYARFVYKDGKYQPWGGDIQSCVACHASVKESDALFTHYQKRY